VRSRSCPGSRVTDRGVLRAQEPKEHGARLAVEGLAKRTFRASASCCVEDVTTTGRFALKAAEAVRDAGGVIALVFTMVDREEGATEAFREAGLHVSLAIQGGGILKG